MYKLFFLTCLLQFTYWLPAQTYKSVLDNTTFVQMGKTGTFVDRKGGAKGGDDPYNWDTETSKDSFCFQEFQYFNGILYSKYTSLPNANYHPDSIELIDAFIYLRESVDKSKLYARRDLSSLRLERLIYDISLEKGDTFRTVIYEYYNMGAGWDVVEIDTNLLVDTVYYQFGRKVIQFNYYQQFGPYSQYFKFIEGIGPSIGIFVQPGYYECFWASLLGTYIKEGKQYDFNKGVLPESNNAPYYSVLKNTGWGHFLASNTFNSNEENNDPYYSGMVKVSDSLTISSIETINGYIKAELISSKSTDIIHLSQTSSCTQLYTNLNDTSLASSKLIYDITLNKGDSFETSVFEKNTQGNWIWLDTTIYVDTVFYEEGRKVVQFNYWQNFGPYSQYYAFIEGIGPTYGLFPLQHESPYAVGCLTNVYTESENQYSFDKTVSIPESRYRKMQIKLFPNPVHYLLHISFNNEKTGKLCLYSFDGKLIQSKNIYNAKDAALEMSIYTNGIYLIEFTDDLNNKYFSKTVKN